MPGFSIDKASGGKELTKNNKAEFRRKHRWRLSSDDKTGLLKRDWLYLSKAQRPSFKFEEAVVHHDQEEAYFAGKNKWDPIELSFYDTVKGDNVKDTSEILYKWILNGVVGLSEKAHVNLPSAYKLNVTIECTSNVGEPDETWTLFGAWPISSNWNDLDYSSSEIQQITVSLKFDRAKRA